MKMFYLLDAAEFQTLLCLYKSNALKLDAVDSWAEGDGTPGKVNDTDSF